MHYNPDLEPDAIGSSDAVAVIDLPEIHIIITGHEEPGSVRATVVEGGSGAVSTGPPRLARDDVSTALPGKDTIDFIQAPDYDFGLTESLQVTEQGHIKCAHDGWHNLIAFSGLSTLLLVILLGLILTRRK